MEGNLDYFQLLTITNNAAMSMVKHVSLWYDRASFVYISRSSIAGFPDKDISNFLGNHQIDFQSGCTSLQPHSPYLVNIILEVLARAIRLKRRSKR